jgi:hypothetical protein
MRDPLTYRALLERLGLSHLQVEAFLGIAARSSRRWLKHGDAPVGILMLLAMMAKHRIGPNEARTMIGLPRVELPAAHFKPGRPRADEAI